MKSFSMRHVLALALALSLAACGGGKATFTIGGTVTGLQYPGMVLTTNGQDVAVNPAAKNADGTVPNVSFAFPTQLEYGDVYDVTIKSPPAHQDCAVSGQYAKDTAGRLSSINIPVACGLSQHFIGGTISGLTVDGLVLTNGSTGGTYTANTGATTFTFAGKVTYGNTYGVTVLTQPAGLVCSVANGTGTMADADVNTMAVTCVPKT
jgi:hypothetical protein